MRDLLGQLRLRFTGLTLQSEGPHGQVYSGRDFSGAEVTVAMLGEQSAADPAQRRAFEDAVRRLEARDREARDAAAVHSTDLFAFQPWAAIRTEAQPSGAAELLAALAGPQPSTDTSAPTPTPLQLESAPAQPAPAPLQLEPAPPPDLRHATGTTAAEKRSGTGIGALAAVAIATGLGFSIYISNQADDTPINLPTAAAPTAAAATPSEPPTPPSMLREVEPVSVIGPVWEPDEETYTMAFPGWPFAFRAPATWLCTLGRYESLPDASAWQCSDPDEPVEGQRLNVMLWACPTTCTEDEQTSMINAWLDEPEQAVTADSGRTLYVETGPDDDGMYSVDLSHFAPDPADPDGPLRWHVGVYLQSPFETRDVPLKVLNDIVTQAS